MQQKSTRIPSLRIYVPFIFSLMIICFQGTKIIPAHQPGGYRFVQSGKNKSAARNDPSDSWLETVKKNIANQEYHFSKEDNGQAFQSLNSSQNFTSRYSANELQLRSSDNRMNWTVNFTLLNIHSDDGGYLHPDKNAIATVEKNLLQYDHHSFVVQYQNTFEGVRQNIIVHKPISKHDRKLRVALQVSNGVRVEEVDQQNLRITQNQDHQKRVLINYGGLRAWDAEGRELQSSLASIDNKIEWIVNVENAIYPVTIDPISTTPDWVSDFGTAVNFGSTVASAGDVNGDGFKEVIVSTPAVRFAGGRLRLGIVYLFYGSVTGLNTSVGWSKISPSDSPGFGLSVSFAGDVNGDGYDDIAVSDYASPRAKGKVVVYYGSPNGLSDTESWIAEPARQNGEFGRSTSLAGDVNMDGYSDLIIGEPKLGTVYAYYGSPGGLGSQPAWQASIGPLSNEFGFIVSSAGDINNDGFSDVIIGTNSKLDGGVYVYYGSPTGLSKTLNWWTKDPDSNQSFFGKLVRSAGDINGDGFSDVAIGHPDFNVPNNGPVAAGKIFVYYGSKSGFRITNYSSFAGNKDSMLLGKAIAAVGDLDGDSFGDLVATAPNDEKVYLFEGSSKGLGKGVVWLSDRDVASIDSAGDINRDGFNDIIVGIPNFVQPNSVGPRVEVYYGFHDGFINIVCPEPTFQCANKSGKYVIPPLKFQGDSSLPISYTITGATTRQGSGTNASGPFNPGTSIISWTVTQSNGIIKTCATKVFINDISIDWFKRIRAGNYAQPNPGDINGDGFNDVINTRVDESNNGLLTVYKGSSAGISKTADTVKLKEYYGTSVKIAKLIFIDPAGDINGDGSDDIITLSRRYGVSLYYGSKNGLMDSATWHWNNPQHNVQLASKAGDVNGDGFGDLMVTTGLPGVIRVFYGSANGLKDIPDWTVPDNIGETFYSLAGSAAGDVNGDGFDDILVVNDPGDIFLFTGSAKGLVQTPVLVSAGPSGFTSLDFRVGDINGDGFDDAIVRKSDSTYLFLGYPGGLKATNSQAPQNSFSAGDVNGDGFDDIVALSFNGPATLYYGTPKGLVADPNSALACLIFIGKSGDINGDGFDDLVVNRDGVELGVYYGKANNINPPDCKNLLVKIPDTSAVKKGGSPNTIYLGYGWSSLLLNANVTGGTKQYHYRWSTGDTTAALRVHPSVAGDYRYSVVVTDSKGCKDSTFKNVRVLDIRCPNPLTAFFKKFFPELLNTPTVHELLKRTTPVTVCVTSNGSSQQRCVSPLIVPNLLASGATLGNCNNLVVKSAFNNRAADEKTGKAFSISASPNPAAGSFRIAIQSNSLQAINLRITDLSGRTVEIIRISSSNSNIMAGSKLRPGTYFVEGVQGKERKVIKIVKM